MERLDDSGTVLVSFLVIKNTSFIWCHFHRRPLRWSKLSKLSLFASFITQDQPSTSDLSHDEIHGDGLENQGGGKSRLKKKKKTKTTTKNNNKELRPKKWFFGVAEADVGVFSWNLGGVLSKLCCWSFCFDAVVRLCENVVGVALSDCAENSLN